MRNVVMSQDENTQSRGESLSTIQSIDSLRPEPVVAEHLNKAQSRSLILDRPSTSLMSFSLAASGRSCLLASTKRGTPCRISFCSWAEILRGLC